MKWKSSNDDFDMLQKLWNAFVSVIDKIDLIEDGMDESMVEKSQLSKAIADYPEMEDLRNRLSERGVEL